MSKSFKLQGGKYYIVVIFTVLMLMLCCVCVCQRSPVYGFQDQETTHPVAKLLLPALNSFVHRVELIARRVLVLGTKCS